MRERARVHAHRGRLGEYPLAVVLAVAEVREHELRHVGRARPDRAGGRGVHELVLVRLEPAAAPRETAGHVGRELRGQRLSRGGLRHPERRENVLLGVVVPRHPRHALDDVSGDGRRVVRVRRVRAGRAHAPGNVRREPLPGGHEARRIIGDQITPVLFEPGRVRHDVAQRDGLTRIGVRDLEVEIPVHVGVEVHLPLLDELHHRGPREQLADGADAEQRPLGADGGSAAGIGDAVSLREEQGAVLHNGDGCAGDVFVAEVRRSSRRRGTPRARRGLVCRGAGSSAQVPGSGSHRAGRCEGSSPGSWAPGRRRRRRW